VRLLCARLSLGSSVWVLVGQIALSALLYVGLLVATRCIGRDEYEILRAIFGKKRPYMTPKPTLFTHKPRVD